MTKKPRGPILTGTNQTQRENTCVCFYIDVGFVFQDVFSLSFSPKRFTCDGERERRAKNQCELHVAFSAAPEFNVDLREVFLL